jgi:hypothetical protein
MDAITARVELNFFIAFLSSVSVDGEDNRESI